MMKLYLIDIIKLHLKTHETEKVFLYFSKTVLRINLKIFFQQLFNTRGGGILHFALTTIKL